MAEWSKVLIRLELSPEDDPEVVGSSPGQAMDFWAILSVLGGYPGRPI